MIHELPKGLSNVELHDTVDCGSIAKNRDDNGKPSLVYSNQIKQSPI